MLIATVVIRAHYVAIFAETMRTAAISTARQTACVVRSPLSGRRLHKTGLKADSPALICPALQAPSQHPHWVSHVHGIWPLPTTGDAVDSREVSSRLRGYFLPPFTAAGPSWALRSGLVASSMPSANFRWDSISCSVKL